MKEQKENFAAYDSRRTGSTCGLIRFSTTLDRKSFAFHVPAADVGPALNGPYRRESPFERLLLYALLTYLRAPGRDVF